MVADGGWGGRLQREAMYIHLWLIRVAVRQKPTQHCKAIVLQIKILKNGSRAKKGSCLSSHLLSSHLSYKILCILDLACTNLCVILA